MITVSLLCLVMAADSSSAQNRISDAAPSVNDQPGVDSRSAQRRFTSSARTELISALQDLEEYLQGAGDEVVSGWKQYLNWNQLADQLERHLSETS